MLNGGESRKEVIRPDFNRAIMIDFQGAQITSDVGFLLVREVDDRFGIIDHMKEYLEDLRSSTHSHIKAFLSPDGAPKGLPDSCGL